VLPSGAVDRENPVQDGRERVERDLARAVAGRALRIVVDLEEYRVDADRHRGPCESRDELAFASGGVP
jgi:hypothetical protein